MVLRADSPVLVLGNGGFGTALALVLEQAGRGVRVWGHDAAYTREIESRRENPKFLPGVPLPPAIRFGCDIARLAADAEVLVSAVPTQFLRATLVALRPHLGGVKLIVSCSKGFERGTHSLPSVLIRESLPAIEVVVLGGPSHAEEIAQRLPATVVVAAADPELAREVQQLVGTATFRAYTSADPLGVEIGGASKNVIALASGISDGLGFGDNARAALICRGASEIARLGHALGARPETLAGLSGMGDLVATCTSRHSRNRAVGERLARGEPLDAILRSTEKVAEGVETTRSLHGLAGRLGVDLPITSEVHAVLFEGKHPRQAVSDLMLRQPRSE